MISKPPSNWSDQDKVAGNGSHQFATEPPKFNASYGGERREVPNSQAQLIKSLLFSVAWIAFGFYLLQMSNPIAKILSLILFVWAPILALKALRSLMRASPAFSYDGDGITMPGWFGEKHVAWRDVSQFSVRTVSTYAYGFIKTSSKHSIYALKAGGGKVLLPTQFTGLDADGLSELAAQLELYRSGMAGLTRRRSSQDHASAAPPPGSAFGRIDTGLAPNAPLASRPEAGAASFGRRPTFGDRVS